MFDSLTQSFTGIFNRLRGKRALTEKNVEDACSEVRRTLLDADVSLQVVRTFVSNVREKAVGQELIKDVDPGQQFVKIVHDEMVELLGPADPSLDFAPSGVTALLLVGLQGSGKTTTVAKLGSRLRNNGRSVLLVAADVRRPAAVEQLKVLAQRTELPVHSQDGADALRVCAGAMERAGLTGIDTLIIDSAGRLHIDGEMMKEVEQLARLTSPREVLYVADAMTGQDAVRSAKAFNELLDVTGVILTKLDGDSRGGAALSVKAVTGKPIKFVGVGEQLDAIEEFHPDRMAGRILGMGDIVGLVEKAQEVVDQEKALEMQRRLLERTFTLQDMLDSLRQARKMGPLGDLMGMIPGLSSHLGGAQVDDGEITGIEGLILSMTPQERAHPEIIGLSRRKRIALGSGRTIGEVGSLLKQFREMRRMFDGKGKFAGMLGSLQGLLPPGTGVDKIRKEKVRELTRKKKELRRRRKREKRNRRRRKS